MGWIHAVIDVPEATVEAASSFWEASFGWPLGEPWEGHPELRSFVPPDGDPYVHLQNVTGPPGVHIDVETDDLSAAREHWVDLGALVVSPPEPGKTSWQVMRSPGGLPFCLVPSGSGRLPSPVIWPEGQRSRPVQVCIDLPADRWQAEVTFWRDGLGWRWVDGSSAEFVGKMHDDHGSPIQLLFQRLGDESGPVRAHLDLGATDLQREAGRHIGLGAAELRPGEGFIALIDPAGIPYCVTGNSPEANERRDLG